MDRLAIAVAEHLELDVTRIAEVLFDIDRGIAERCLGFGAGLLDQRFELVRAIADLHAAPAAAAGGLDDHRIAGCLCNRLGLGNVADRAVRSRDQWQTQRAGGTLGFDLVTHGADVFGLGPDPGDVVTFDNLGELRVFRKEAIARVDRVGMGDFSGRNDRRDIEVAVLGRRRADADRMVGEPHVHGIGIGCGVHRHRLDPHFVRGAVDAQSDLAAIGDQDAGNAHDLCPTRSRPAAGRIRPAARFRPGSP